MFCLSVCFQKRSIMTTGKVYGSDRYKNRLKIFNFWKIKATFLLVLFQNVNKGRNSSDGL